jgi:glycogen debranching enzyme
MTGLATAARARVAKARAAFERLWSEEHGQYLCLDRVTGALVESRSVGGLLPLFAGLGTPERQRALAARIAEWRGATRFGIASHDPADPRFEAKRYWRGPVWLIVSYLVADGLARCGLAEAADAVHQDSLKLIEGGFAEYYDPVTGEGLGGGNFTWTAAMVAELVCKRTA